MLTQKDFKAIAEIIKNGYNVPYGFIVAKPFISKMADYLATQNPQFDRNKFLTACGVK